ncbi:MAG: DUF401 family protein [Tindallia sp. MSAO_Bac2]|nr:MAG: DUF401 family protein [Tindallia sp. MSAO_Bac2]
MFQLIATVIAFLVIPVMLRYKFKLSTTIVTTTIILALLSRLGFQALANIAVRVFVDPYSRDTVLTIFIVSMLGGAMKHYGLLDAIVDGILGIVKNKKIVLMLIPSLIGTLIIPGGAILSAPFVDDIGGEVGLKPPRRAVINLIFRHIAMLVFPFSMALLFLRSALPSVNVYRIIMMNTVFLGILLTVAYFLYLKDINVLKDKNSLDSKDFLGSIRKLITYTSPIYAPVLINTLTGAPFYQAMLISVIIVYLLSNKEKFPQVLKRSANWDTVKIVIAVLIMKDIILEMDAMLSVFDYIFQQAGTSISMMLVFMVTSLFFGFITGYPTSALAVTLPMLSRLQLPPDQLHIFAFFLLISSFLGYYFSPVHLCQAFTLKVMKVSTKDLYKEYAVYAMAALLILVSSTTVLLYLYV